MYIVQSDALEKNDAFCATYISATDKSRSKQQQNVNTS